jgi:hypothetical protein
MNKKIYRIGQGIHTKEGKVSACCILVQGALLISGAVVADELDWPEGSSLVIEN